MPGKVLHCAPSQEMRQNSAVDESRTLRCVEALVRSYNHKNKLQPGNSFEKAFVRIRTITTGSTACHGASSSDGSLKSVYNPREARRPLELYTLYSNYFVDRLADSFSSCPKPNHSQKFPGPPRVAGTHAAEHRVESLCHELFAQPDGALPAGIKRRAAQKLYDYNPAVKEALLVKKSLSQVERQVETLRRRIRAATCSTDSSLVPTRDTSAQI